MEKISACRACGSRQIKTFFYLGRQPLANSLLTDLKTREQKYPLSLSWCANCSLVQLNQTVDPKKLFSKYVWVTGTSAVAQKFSEEFCKLLIKKSGGRREGYVLEIASNDGTFLLPFRRRGYRVLGIDPARNIVRLARQAGIPSKPWFFGSPIAERLIKEYGHPQFIFARNVLPHVADTRDFIRGLKLSMSHKSIAAIEVHYGKIIQEELHYDSIYHEHLCYFTLKSLERLLNEFGLFIFDIEVSPISGGSIIIYLRNRKIKEQSVVQKYRLAEFRAKTNSFSSWKNFARRAFNHKALLLAMLRKTKQAHQVILGYGASARSSTLLNFCGLDSRSLQLIADKNTLKHNKFTAGSRIKIVSPAVAMSLRPSLVFILAWNFEAEIRKLLKGEFGYNGKYIIPLPYKPRFL